MVTKRIKNTPTAPARRKKKIMSVSFLLSLTRSSDNPLGTSTGSRRYSSPRLFDDHVHSEFEGIRGGKIIAYAGNLKQREKREDRQSPLSDLKGLESDLKVETESSHSFRERLESSFSCEEGFLREGYLAQRVEAEEVGHSLSPPPLPKYWSQESVLPSMVNEKIFPWRSLDQGDMSETESGSDSEEFPSVSMRGSIPQSETESEPIPVIYRYFGRSRTRSKRDSVPFILLGLNVDHWKVVGKELASLGFNVMAVEPVTGEGSQSSRTGNGLNPGEGTELIQSVMDALKWKKAVIVGCDEYAVAAIEAARAMAPRNRIAGLILCGDLAKTERYFEEGELMTNDLSSHWYLSFDHFLHHSIPCPCNVIWDGDAFALVKQRSQSWKTHISPDCANPYGIRTDLRSVIVGGGSAPHRRLPEHFAWVLTRFVEERLAKDDHIPKRTIRNREEQDTFRGLKKLARNLFLPREKAKNDQFWLVTGRILATAMLYMCSAKISLHQYENACGNVSAFKSQLSTWQLRAVQLANNILKDDFRRKDGSIENIDSTTSTDFAHLMSDISLDENEIAAVVNISAARKENIARLLGLDHVAA